MAELALILVGALLVNNFVLAQFLGLCPFIGVSGNYDAAVAMGFATTFVLTLSATVSYMAYHWLLLPLELEFMRVIVFIVVIAALVQLTEAFLRNTSPVLHNALGIYLPLITTNCAVLGVALLAINQSLSLLGTMAYAVGAAVGFTLVLVVFAAMRERLAHANVPAAFRGAPITLISAGILSLAFLGFAGLGN
jgi:electron transport complex protein RnfA